MAARSGGYHFRYDGTQWLDTKGAGGVLPCLSREANAQAGQSLVFASA